MAVKEGQCWLYVWSIEKHWESVCCGVCSRTDSSVLNNDSVTCVDDITCGAAFCLNSWLTVCRCLSAAAVVMRWSWCDCVMLDGSEAIQHSTAVIDSQVCCSISPVVIPRLRTCGPSIPAASAASTPVCTTVDWQGGDIGLSSNINTDPDFAYQDGNFDYQDRAWRGPAGRHNSTHRHGCFTVILEINV